MQALQYAVRRIFAIITLLIPLVLHPARTSADEILMRDGSRLLGEVLKRENGILDFKTSYAGTLKIQWAEIAEIRTEKPMEFLLTDDSTLVATHVINNAEDLIVQSEPGSPQRTLAQEVVAVVNPEAWRKGQGYKFSGRANLAFQRQRGNTDKDELDIDGDLTWRRKYDRFTGFGELERDRNNNRKSTDKWKLEGTYSHFVSRKWYWGGFGRLEHDRFADLELRSSVGPQLGYQWFESKKMNLRTATGISYVSQNFINQSDDDYAALPWSIDFDRFLFDQFAQFYHKQIGFWNLKDTANLVWDTWTGLRFPLILGLVASTEAKVEYDSGAAQGAEQIDITYNLKLGYQW